jgi:hypothetical protein
MPGVGSTSGSAQGYLGASGQVTTRRAAAAREVWSIGFENTDLIMSAP